jgi:hypothetical protein
MEPLSLPPLELGGLTLQISSKNSLKWLGVELDATITMKPFVDETCKTCFFQLRMIRSIRNSTLLLCNSLVISCLDYSNSLLIFADSRLFRKLRKVLHLAARYVKRCSRSEHITPVLKELHWCHIEDHPKLKILCLVFKGLCGQISDYLADDLKVYVPRCAVRASDSKHVTLELGSARKKDRKMYLFDLWSHALELPSAGDTYS